MLRLRIGLLTAAALVGCGAEQGAARASMRGGDASSKPGPKVETSETRTKEPEGPRMKAVGPPLRPLYHGCASDFRVESLGGEILATYQTEGIARFDRIGHGGEVVEAIDLDLSADERSLGRVIDLEGASIDDFFVALEFDVPGTGQETRLVRREHGQWTKPRYLSSGLARLIHWPRGRVLALGRGPGPVREPVFEWVDGPESPPDVNVLLPRVSETRGAKLDRSHVGAPNLISLSASPDGFLVVLVTHEPARIHEPAPALGSWLMIWSGPATAPRIERVTSEVVATGEGSVLALGKRIFVTLGDAPTLEWIDGELESLGDVSGHPETCSTKGEPVRVRGLDPQGRLWITQGACLALRTSEGWQVEALPPGAGQLWGLASGQASMMVEDGGLWTRVGPGEWASHRGPDPGAAKPWVRSHVIAGDAWLTLSYDADPHPLVDDWQSSAVYTTRAVAQPNPCRRDP